MLARLSFNHWRNCRSLALTASPLACSLAILLCSAERLSAAEPGSPAIGDIQAAYEREAARSDGRHDKDLAVTSAECTRSQSQPSYLCWIAYTIASDPKKAVTYDVASVEIVAGGWTLKSGLCKR
jgi:hypothetical protein